MTALDNASVNAWPVMGWLERLVRFQSAPKQAGRSPLKFLFFSACNAYRQAYNPKHGHNLRETDAERCDGSCARDGRERERGVGAQVGSDVGISLRQILLVGSRGECVARTRERLGSVDRSEVHRSHGVNHKEFSSRGGKARAKALSKEQRKEIASAAAKKRWKTHRRGSARAQKSNVRMSHGANND